MSEWESDLDDGSTCIWVCQGPPRCPLMDMEAVEAQKAGCRWCTRIYVSPDRPDETIAPGEA